MERKIMKLGNSTNVISLPSSWIKENELKKGDVVDLKIRDGVVIINRVNRKKNKSIYLDMSKKFVKEALGFIENAYVAGYTEIRVKLPFSFNSENDVESVLNNNVNEKSINESGKYDEKSENKNIMNVSNDKISDKLDKSYRSSNRKKVNWIAESNSDKDKNNRSKGNNVKDENDSIRNDKEGIKTGGKNNMKTNVVKVSKNDVISIHQMINMLTGFMVVSEKGNTIVVREVSETNDDELDVLVNRTVYLYLDLMKSMIDSLENQNFDLLGNMYERDRALNRYLLYTLRIIFNTSTLVESKRMIYYFFVQSIDGIFDNLVKLASLVSSEFLNELDKNVSKKVVKDEAMKIVDDLKVVDNYLRIYVRFFQSFNLSYADKMVVEKERIKATGFKSKHSSFFISMISDIYSNHFLFLPYLLKLREIEEFE
ncbi:MAG: hypothetical protein GWP09_00645 [Nitrospiraceae bacterium]|nr:hypothetical protein [Nitrospiraceae bacterium]